MFWIVFVSQAPLLFFSFCGGGDAEANQQFKKNKKNSRNTSKKKKDQKAILKTCPVSSLVQQEKHRLAFFFTFHLFISIPDHIFLFFLPSFFSPSFNDIIRLPLFLPPSLFLFISHPASLFLSASFPLLFSIHVTFWFSFSPFIYFSPRFSFLSLLLFIYLSISLLSPYILMESL